MQAAARDALEQTLGGGLNFVAEDPLEPSQLQFVLLELLHERAFMLPEGSSIVLNLFDHKATGPQRAQMARDQRTRLELLVRLMNAPATRWNTFYHELWEPVLLQRLRTCRASAYADQRTLMGTRALPTFVLCMAADDLSDSDFGLCLEFMTRPSNQALSLEQQELLRRVESGAKPQQLVIELGLQLSDCRPTKQLMRTVQRLLDRLEAVDRDDFAVFPVKFQITTLRFGLTTCVLPSNMDVLQDLADMTGICVQHKLSESRQQDQQQWADSLEDFPPRVLLDPCLRSVDLSCLTLTRQHVRSVCSALRATDHIQEVVFMRHYVSDPAMNELQRNELWAWIAFGILHRDSRSTLKQLTLSGQIGSDKSMLIVCRILTSAHPGRDLLLAIDPELKSTIRSEAMPLPRGKRLFVSVQAQTELLKAPNRGASAVLIHSMEEEMRFEVLIQLSSGWTCILLPAYGVAWITTSCIVETHLQGSSIRYDDGVRSNFWLKGLDWPFAYYQDVLLLLRAIGHSLEYLSVPYAAGVALASVLDYCPNLKHLKSSGNAATCPSLLLNAYKEGQCKIERLSIGIRDGPEQGLIREVARLVAHSSVKQLQQLQFNISEHDMSALDELIQACHENTTLELLELRIMDSTLLNQVKERFHGLRNQTLAVLTSNATKWALLSVIKHYRTRPNTAMSQFDSLITSRILQFAGFPIRRSVIIIQS